MDATSAIGPLLYTNSNSRHDFLRGAFDAFAARPQTVLIAVAFLTDPEPILKLAAAGSRVKLVVRLGFPTRPAALRRLMEVDEIQLRAISSATFHPKLYIFSLDGAIVGSSNMTQAALSSNQEVNVLIPTADPCFADLTATFDNYWRQVHPLDEATIRAYERVLDDFKAVRKSLEGMDTRSENLLAARIDNVDRGRRMLSRSDFFVEEYRAQYQGFLAAFKNVHRVYREAGRRKYSEETVPLRLEVDAFLGWVRSRYTVGDSYLEAPLRVGGDLERAILSALQDWFTEDYRHMDDVALRRYPLLKRTLGSRESIASASYDEILEALSCETSFFDRFRFYRGGHMTHVAAFREANELPRVRELLTYLLFGTDEAVVRMYRLIHDPEFRLREFGRSAVQELLGWINSEEIPICNSRTLKSLRWLGFDLALYGD